MNIRRIVHAVRSVLLYSAVALPLVAQTKKPITQDTYDLWRVIQGASLSPDGKFAMYTLSPVVGDGEVIVRSTAASTEWRFARGYTGRPQLMPAADSAAIFMAPPAQFSAGSSVAAFITYAPRAEFENARKAKPRPLPAPFLVVALIIRTIDVGGDKPLPYLNLPAESNPYLGYRGLRIYEDHAGIITSQLRAIAQPRGTAPQVNRISATTLSGVGFANQFPNIQSAIRRLAFSAILFGRLTR